MVKYMREKYPKETQDLSDRNVLVWRELSIVNIRVKYPEDTNWMFDDAVLEWKGLFDEDETKPYLEPFEDLKPIEPETTNSSGAMPGEAPMESSVVQGQTDSTNEDFNDAYALEASDQSNEPSAGTIQDNQVGGSERNDDAPPSYDSVDSNQENVGHQNEHAASTGGNINEGTAPSPSTPPNQLVLRHRSPPSPNFGPGRSITIFAMCWIC
ncbi:hypothetical protein EJ08DRAFT_4877 [Tothia fuscella]|uniref:Uncharacterized protein n=1 Tax=Tothia fuscella TaxID=1048955 RepID=A0A9P4P5F7_9PEZI|nr:hypothetical protein EJ08DRAFT_4877 [Tothia fuscella]